MQAKPSTACLYVSHKKKLPRNSVEDVPWNGKDACVWYLSNVLELALMYSGYLYKIPGQFWSCIISGLFLLTIVGILS